MWIYGFMGGPDVDLWIGPEVDSAALFHLSLNS